MHLLKLEASRIDDGEEAIDLDLAPAPIVLLTSADSELTAFVDAARAGDHDLRIASIASLAHPMSVDLAIDKTLRHAALIAVRLIGGEGYWPYGLERLRALARGGGPRLLLVSGEPTWDDALAAGGSVDNEAARAFHALCREGGPANRRRALDLLADLAGGKSCPDVAPAPFPVAGVYWPGDGALDSADLAARWTEHEVADRPVAAVLFYRSHLQDGLTGGVDALVPALVEAGLRPLPVFASSLKAPQAAAIVERCFAAQPPAIVLTTMGFSLTGGSDRASLLERLDVPVLQVVQAGTDVAAWRGSTRGLGVKDLAMSVVTTELDGHVLTRAVAFKARDGVDAKTGARPVRFKPLEDRVRFVVALAAAWTRLREAPPARRRVALVLANYPGKDGRLANGVGLDTPASTVAILEAMRAAGYCVDGAPGTSEALMARLLAGPTNAPGSGARADAAGAGAGAIQLPLATYQAWLAILPAEARAALEAEWGQPEGDPTVGEGRFRLAAHVFGNTVVAIQPTRGYERDVKATYHDPALVPTHAYLAFHLWLREVFGAHAVVHVGKHGNLEWLPGKALALSEACWPEIALGPLPQLYPFIVNDPGEGSQAKRRTSAVVVDHLTPPMTRAETHGAAADLERLIDEYALARAIDPRRATVLGADIVDLSRRHGFDRDLGLGADADIESAVTALDAHICDLKELQIRDGLHVFGASPQGRLRTDLACALARLRTPPATPAALSLQRAIAADLGMEGFDPMDCDPATAWEGPRPEILASLSADEPWRTAGDAVERIELLAARFVGGDARPAAGMAQTASALNDIEAEVLPRLDRSGGDEMAALLAGLDARFVRPGPAGAPTRGRLDVLPTGRNFFSVDIRAVPTEAAWRIGAKAAAAVVDRYVMEEGDWPRAIAFTCWGTANMRTGGDDIAQAMALIGARPVWEKTSGRVTGFEVIAPSELLRPRVDVTLRISGFFRDAFPDQINLFQSAVDAIAALDEDAGQNPVAARVAADRARLAADGLPEALAATRAGARIFGAMPGAYGAGLQALIDGAAWDTRDDLADAFVTWGGYSYGQRREGDSAHADLRSRLAATDLVVQAQDNREHDILDSDDYYQFEGGLAAAVETLSGRAPVSLHVDTSRPETPKARTLAEEISRVVRGRAANPKWIAGMMRHGYKGAFEMAATVDYLFAFAATTNAVSSHHFDQLYAAYLEDEDVRGFIAAANAPALAEIAARFAEAIERGLWQPASNSAHHRLADLAAPQVAGGSV